MKVRTVGVILFLSFLFSAVFAQRPQLDQGAVGLALALRRLPATGSLLDITAHPDDEDNALLVMMRRGRGLRTGLLTLTRGDGGQNEIGPELFQALGIIRSEELMSMHRYDDARQFFTRAYEFGYSFSVEETLERWGEEPILEDMVRVIRSFRPQVILSLPRGGEGGGQHHQASARLAEKAFHAAADPARFPHQLQEGLRPWKAAKLYERFRWQGGGPEGSAERPARVVEVSTGAYDPILGRTFAQLGHESRSMHKCQGMAQLLAAPGQRSSLWNPVASQEEMKEGEADLFEGIDTTLMVLARFTETDLDRLPFLVPSIHRIQLAIRQAGEAFDPRDPGLTTPFVAEGLRRLRLLRQQFYASGLSEEDEYEIFFLLNKKEEDFVHALNLANQMVLEATVDDGRVTPGQELELTLVLFNGGSHPVVVWSWEVATKGDWQIEYPGNDFSNFQLGAGEVRTFKVGVRVSSDAEVTEPYWSGPMEDADRFRIQGKDASAPWGPPELFVQVGYRSFGVESTLGAPAEYRYTGPWVGGEQRHDLMVVPRISLAVEPEISVLPLSAARKGRELRVQVTHNGNQAVAGEVVLEAPRGWKIVPPFHLLKFEREEESIATTFTVYPPENLREGTLEIQAVGGFGGQSFGRGFQVIDYHHIQRRHLYRSAQVRLQVLNVEIDPEVRVGYIVGVGDYVPEALGQLEADFELLGPDQLASSDLDRFDTIFTGVRAYLNREDLKAYNDRLLQWVEQGGTLIVQYNKFEFNGPGSGGSAQKFSSSPFAPFPVVVGRGRVTDERAPIRVLAPDHPLFLVPNEIGEEDWQGWVQERGLYFLGQKDARYRDLVAMEDPFPFNADEKLGALVEARYGKGRWIYVGLGLWRQLPAGVPGSYRLLANLVSLGRAE